MPAVRGLGNVLINAAFRVLVGRGTGDLLSGYRAFGRRFREAVTLRSGGFEIETELASEAVARRLRVVEIEVPYHPRIAGTSSKLKALRDGRRILLTIVGQSLRLRPWRPMLLVLVPTALAAWAVGPWAWAIGAALEASALIGALKLAQRVEPRGGRANGG
jgi:hypothetical protein